MNLPTAGVLSAAKNDFILTAVTNILAAYRKNAIAVFVHCNRAGDQARTNPGGGGGVLPCSALVIGWLL